MLNIYQTESASHAYRFARQRAQETGQYVNPYTVMQGDDAAHIAAYGDNILVVTRRRESLPITREYTGGVETYAYRWATVYRVWSL